MKQYFLEVVKGTEKFVGEELKEKHPKISIQKVCEEIIFTSDETLQSFSDILSGIRITQDGFKNSLNLCRRKWRKEFVPAGINPALAYVMCEIAEINKIDVILDPFCGGGTIPITAMSYFNPKQVIASDLSGKAVDITERNLIRARVKNIMVFRSDVSKLKLGAGSVSKIITNLPFGIREKTHGKNIEIYKRFIVMAERVVKPHGLIVVLTQEIKLLQEVINSSSFKKIADYPIEQGGLRPHIFMFQSTG